MVTAILWYMCTKNGLDPTGWLYFLTVVVDLAIINKIQQWR